MDVQPGAKRPVGRSHGVSTMYAMPKIRKMLPLSIVHVSTVVPQADLSVENPRKGRRLGALFGISSVLAMDFTPKLLPTFQPKSLRDDWLALGGDLRVVMARAQRDVIKDALPQKSLLGSDSDT